MWKKETESQTEPEKGSFFLPLVSITKGQRASKARTASKNKVCYTGVRDQTT